MRKLLDFVINFYSTLFFVITLIATFYFFSYKKETLSAAFLHGYLFWNIGIRGIIAYIANTYTSTAQTIAQAYNWQPQTHIQRELAAYSGSLGILGVMCLWIKGPFWLATLVGATLSCILAEAWNLKSIFVEKQHAFAKGGSKSSYIISTALLIGMHLDLVVACIALCIGVYTLMPLVLL